MDRFSKNFENNTDKVWVEMELKKYGWTNRRVDS
jgi:hypothetical protein